MKKKIKTVLTKSSGREEFAFEWKRAGHVIARIVLHADGLVEFYGNEMEVAIEHVGREDQAILVNNNSHITIK